MNTKKATNMATVTVFANITATPIIGSAGTITGNTGILPGTIGTIIVTHPDTAIATSTRIFDTIGTTITDMTAQGSAYTFQSAIQVFASKFAATGTGKRH